MSITYSEKYSSYIDPNIISYSAAEQTFYRFPNGYGASVIYGQFSYGLEVAVIRFISQTEIDYDTPLTDDVIGYVEELDEVLKSIKKLK